MNKTLFFSGTPRTWQSSRHIGVSKSCKRVLVRGLAEAYKDPKFDTFDATLKFVNPELGYGSFD